MGRRRKNCCPWFTTNCANWPPRAWPRNRPDRRCKPPRWCMRPGSAWWAMATARGRTARIFLAPPPDAMRRILIENARRKSRLKRGGGQVRLNIEELEMAATTPDDKILLIDEALARLQVEDPHMARVVMMKYFGGMTNQEAAESLGVTERTVERQWAYAKAWLFRDIRSQG